MIRISELRTQRMSVFLKELSIKQSVDIALISPHMNEHASTIMLRYAIENMTVNKIGDDLSDPIKWTVQERLMAVSHYLAATTDTGPDFDVGEEGKYSDYLRIGNDESDVFSSDPIVVGDVGGDVWFIRHLTGEMVESVERLDGEIGEISGRLHWIMGCMAAQLYRKEDMSVGDHQGDIDKMLMEKMTVFSSFSESDFTNLLGLYYAARVKLNHLFEIDFSNNGIVALPAERKGVSDLPPARFPSHACITEFTSSVVGKREGNGV